MRIPLLLLTSTTVFAACGGGGASGGSAGGTRDGSAGGTGRSTVYSGGTIITMAGDSAETVEALVVRDGKIAFVGTTAGADSAAGSGATRVDLAGRTLLPGFVDAHGHVSLVGLQAWSADLLPPPDGVATSIDSLVAITRRWADSHKAEVATVGWIVGFGYDDAQLTEKRHPTADDVDRISTEVPVLLFHQSAHLGAVNHKALELLGITDTTSDPAGGVIRRVKGTRTPDGVLEESAMRFPAFAMLSKVPPAMQADFLAAGQARYARFGFTTVQDGGQTDDQVATAIAAAKAGKLQVDVVGYPLIDGMRTAMSSGYVGKEYQGRFRIGGIKIVADGSIQGFTAWLTKPYHVRQPGKAATYAGYAAYPDSLVDRWVDSAYSAGWQLLVHNNGDASGDQMIRAVRKAVAKHGPGDRRTVCIHCQTVRDDQLDYMKELGIVPSFFTMHTFYWGDLHRTTTLGPVRAARISPTATALAKGMWFTTHHDAPVANPDARRVLASTVERTTRSGFALGEDQRLSPYVALLSVTRWAARQYFEEDRKGSLEPGKLADLVILDRNPLTAEPGALATLGIMETIKEGKTVYRAEATTARK
jgi:predicted amidohydrolase YtcJ